MWLATAESCKINRERYRKYDTYLKVPFNYYDWLSLCETKLSEEKKQYFVFKVSYIFYMMCDKKFKNMAHEDIIFMSVYVCQY